MSINVSIDNEAEQKRIADVPALCEKAQIVISNQAEYESAAVVLKDVKSRYKELDSQRKEITKPLDDAKKKVMELFKTPLDLLEKAESKVKHLMMGYTEEQERKARDEQLRLQRIAEKAAEEERKKLEAKIARAEASGKIEKAEELAEQKENIMPIVVPIISPAINTPKGVSYRDKWYAVIVDEKLLPREYLIPNMDALNKIAIGTKGSLKIPGVEFKSEKILSSRMA